MAKNPSHAPTAVLITRIGLSAMRKPHLLLQQIRNAANIIASTISEPGMIPATNSSDIGRFSRNP